MKYWILGSDQTVYGPVDSFTATMASRESRARGNSDLYGRFIRMETSFTNLQ